MSSLIFNGELVLEIIKKEMKNILSSETFDKVDIDEVFFNKIDCGGEREMLFDSDFEIEIPLKKEKQ